MLPASGASCRGTTGAVFETSADKYWHPYGVDVMTSRSPDQIYSDPEAGRLNIRLDDAVSATYLFLKKPQEAGYALKGKKVTDLALSGQRAGSGFPKGDDLRLQQQLSQAIAALCSDRSFSKLSHQWFTCTAAVRQIRSPADIPRKTIVHPDQLYTVICTDCWSGNTVRLHVNRIASDDIR